MSSPVSQPHIPGRVTGLDEAIQKTQAARDSGGAPAQPAWVTNVKRVLAGVVVAAGAGAAIFPPHTIAHQVCMVIMGLGGLGITSQGVSK